MQTDWLERVEVFFGDANNAEARVYARLPADGVPPSVRLTGSVVGPVCAYAHTLSAAIQLTPKRTSHEQTPGAAPAPLSEAIIPDPCFWSAELPFLYRVEVELRQGDILLGATQRMLGIRPLGAQGRRLMFEGRPWVIRGAERTNLPQSELPAWRAADLAMMVDDPDEELCSEASRLGIVLAARLCGAAEPAEAAVRRLARWPCVALAMADAGNQMSKPARAFARNLLLAQQFGGDVKAVPAEWADVVVCMHKEPQSLAQCAAGSSLPVVAWRPGRHDNLALARRACDQLQRELARCGDFAGYLV